jgi:hypothetical protein
LPLVVTPASDDVATATDPHTRLCIAASDTG